MQEALTNTLKHAAGATAAVEVDYGADSLDALGLTDSGCDERAGAATARAGGEGGHGLVGMRERAEIYGGHLDAGPSESGGFCVSARFPLERTSG